MQVRPDEPATATIEQAFPHWLAGDGAAPAAQAEAGALVAVFDLQDWRPFLAQAAVLVDVEERARASRQRRQSNREALVLAYALHRLLLARVLGCASGDVPLGRDAKGCPRLRGDRLFTSLCHAGTRVAIAVAAAGPVGVDVEPVARERDMQELAERVAHPEELRALAGLPPEARSQTLLALWVRKEALLKAAGIGLEVEMDTFVAPCGVALPLPGDTFRGRCVEVRPLALPGWAGAVAVPPGVSVVLAAPPGTCPRTPPMAAGPHRMR